MATGKKTKKTKPQYLNSDNAIQVANRGMNPAYTQTQGQLSKNPETGKYEKTQDMVTSTRSGRMSVDGKRAGGYTHTMTPKNADGSPVLGKDGKPRQSGRSRLASRRQRDYDIRVGLADAWQDANGLWHGGPAPEGVATGADNAARVTTG